MLHAVPSVRHPTDGRPARRCHGRRGLLFLAPAPAPRPDGRPTRVTSRGTPMPASGSRPARTPGRTRAPPPRPGPRVPVPTPKARSDVLTRDGVARAPHGPRPGPPPPAVPTPPAGRPGPGRTRPGPVPRRDRPPAPPAVLRVPPPGDRRPRSPDRGRTVVPRPVAPRRPVPPSPGRPTGVRLTGAPPNAAPRSAVPRPAAPRTAPGRTASGTSNGARRNGARRNGVRQNGARSPEPRWDEPAPAVRPPAVRAPDVPPRVRRHDARPRDGPLPPAPPVLPGSRPRRRARFFRRPSSDGGAWPARGPACSTRRRRSQLVASVEPKRGRPSSGPGPDQPDEVWVFEEVVVEDTPRRGRRKRQSRSPTIRRPRHLHRIRPGPGGQGGQVGAVTALRSRERTGRRRRSGHGQQIVRAHGRRRPRLRARPLHRGLPHHQAARRPGPRISRGPGAARPGLLPPRPLDPGHRPPGGGPSARW